MSSCHFLTQLNKLHGSSVHLNRGNSHDDSLYNISSQYIRELYQIFHYFGIHHNTLAKIPMPLLSQLLASNFAIYSFIIFRSSTKNPNIFDLPTPHFLFKSLEFKSNEFEFKSFNHGLSIFLGSNSFLRVRENYPLAHFLSLTLLFFSSLFLLFC